MSVKSILVAAPFVIAISMSLFLWPLVGIVVVGLIAIAIPVLLISGRNGVTHRQSAGPGASGPGERGYGGQVGVGEDGAAAYEDRRRAS